MAKPKTVLYFINDLFGGGAQKGLVNLLEAGFFKDANLHVATIIRGDGCMQAELLKHIPPSNLHMFSGADRMKTKHLLAALIKYPKLLLKLEPTVTILSLPQANIVGRFWGHLLPMFRIFAFEHSIAYAKKSYAHILKALSLTVRGILTDSPRTGEETTRFFLPFRSYKIIELPLYTGQVAPSHLKKSTKIAGTVKLLTTGRLTPAKNHPALFQAIKILKKEGVKVHLTVIGNGELEAALINLAAELGLQQEITFAGYLMPWTAECPKADIYLQPSLREGLCITVVEAMRHGLPTIASARGGILDYGVDGSNMLFTNPEDPADIAAKIKTLAADEALRTKLSQNARSSMDARFGTAPTQAKLAAARAVLGF